MGFLFNTDGTEIDVTRTNFAYESEQISEELRLSGQAGDNFRWLVGAYYLDEDKRGALALQRWTNNIVAVDPFTIILPNDDTGEAYALFFDGTYSFNEQMSLSFGGRYSDEEKTDITSFANRPGTITLTDASQPGLFVDPQRRSPTGTTSARAVVLEISPDSEHLYYLSVSKGFKCGRLECLRRSACLRARRALGLRDRRQDRPGGSSRPPSQRRAFLLRLQRPAGQHLPERCRHHHQRCRSHRPRSRGRPHRPAQRAADAQGHLHLSRHRVRQLHLARLAVWVPRTFRATSCATPPRTS